jgi:hypothetical protein
MTLRQATAKNFAIYPGKPTEKPATLDGLLQGYADVLHNSQYVPGRARLSEDSGRKFAASLTAQRQQKTS